MICDGRTKFGGRREGTTSYARDTTRPRAADVSGKNQDEVHRFVRLLIIRRLCADVE